MVHLAVEVEVREGLVLEVGRVEAEQARQVVVRADLTAVGRVLEVVRLDVLADALANIRAADERARGLVEELAQLVRHGNRLLEAAVRARLALGALALGGLAHVLNGLLHGGLNRRHHRLVRLAEAVVLGLQGIYDTGQLSDELVRLSESGGHLYGRLSGGGGSVAGVRRSLGGSGGGSSGILSAAYTAGSSGLLGRHSRLCLGSGLSGHDLNASGVLYTRIASVS